MSEEPLPEGITIEACMEAADEADRKRLKGMSTAELLDELGWRLRELEGS